MYHASFGVQIESCGTWPELISIISNWPDAWMKKYSKRWSMAATYQSCQLGDTVEDERRI